MSEQSRLLRSLTALITPVTIDEQSRREVRAEPKPVPPKRPASGTDHTPEESPAHNEAHDSEPEASTPALVDVSTEQAPVTPLSETPPSSEPKRRNGHRDNPYLVGFSPVNDDEDEIEPARPTVAPPKVVSLPTPIAERETPAPVKPAGPVEFNPDDFDPSRYLTNETARKKRTPQQKDAGQPTTDADTARAMLRELANFRNDSDS